MHNKVGKHGGRCILVVHRMKSRRGSSRPMQRHLQAEPHTSRSSLPPTCVPVRQRRPSGVHVATLMLLRVCGRGYGGAQATACMKTNALRVHLQQPHNCMVLPAGCNCRCLDTHTGRVAHLAGRLPRKLYGKAAGGLVRIRRRRQQLQRARRDRWQRRQVGGAAGQVAALCRWGWRRGWRAH